MYSRMKRKCSFIVLVVMVVSLLMVSGMPVHADSYTNTLRNKVKSNFFLPPLSHNPAPDTLPGSHLSESLHSQKQKTSQN